MRALGYAPVTIRIKRQIFAEMSRWCVRHRVAAFDDQRLSEFLCDRRRCYQTTGTGIRATGLRVIECLRSSGALGPAPDFPQDGVRRIESGYAAYLRDERGVGQRTVSLYMYLVHPLVVEHFGNGPRGLDGLDAAGVVRFVLHHASMASVAYAKRRVTALRSFMRFAYLQGATKLDLAAAVPTVPQWRLARLPRFIPADEVRRIVRSCDRSTPIGRRDHAILVLLARLGLRAGEVSSLTLEDIDWDAGELIVHGKGPREDRIPLPSDVGRAVAEYVRRDRPGCPSRAVFIRGKAPLCSLGSKGVGHVVKSAITRTGIQTPSQGTHLLRRGGSLPEIAELLRHRSPETTMLYAKVDLPALRRVPPPWPA